MVSTVPFIAIENHRRTGTFGGGDLISQCPKTSVLFKNTQSENKNVQNSHAIIPEIAFLKPRIQSMTSVNSLVKLRPL